MKQYHRSLVILVVALLLLVMAAPSLALVWDIETVDSGGNLGAYASLALDAQGRPHISYADLTNGRLKYAHWDGTAWHIEVVDSGNVGNHTSIEVDAQGRPHISYQHSAVGVHKLKYARWDGSAWQIAFVDQGGDVGYESSLELDDNGLPHISYLDFGNTALKYAYYDGSAWHTETVDNSGSVGFENSLALDSNNRPHISYGDSSPNFDLKYAYWDGSAWQIETVDDDGNVGGFTSLVLDSNDQPHISYRADGNSSLKYARWDGSTWHIETVDNDGDTGRYTSLALDAAERPHISYYDFTGQDLRYARWDGTTWQIEIADSLGNAGQYSSLALDAEGRPHIAYRAGISLIYALGREPSAAYFLSTTTAGSVDGIEFGKDDILRVENEEWSLFFDGNAHGLKANQSINAFYLGNIEAADDVYLSFLPKKANVPGVGKVQGTDIVHFNGSGFSLYFDGSDVALTTASERIDGLHILDGSAAPGMFDHSCQAYLLISTIGAGRVTAFGGGRLKFQGEDILGFCATNTGPTTNGYWTMVLDGSAEGMPKNSTDSLSANEDGSVIYLTTKGVFTQDDAFGGHSMVYKFEGGEFSGPLFRAPANGLNQKVDGLHVGGDLP